MIPDKKPQYFEEFFVGQMVKTIHGVSTVLDLDSELEIITSVFADQDSLLKFHGQAGQFETLDQNLPVLLSYREGLYGPDLLQRSHCSLDVETCLYDLAYRISQYLEDNTQTLKGFNRTSLSIVLDGHVSNSDRGITVGRPGNQVTPEWYINYFEKAWSEGHRLYSLRCGGLNVSK